jgi:hypothetical protein
LFSLRKAKLVRFGILRYYAAPASRGVMRHERWLLICLEKIGFASPKSPERVSIAPGRRHPERGSLDCGRRVEKDVGARDKRGHDEGEKDSIASEHAPVSPYGDQPQRGLRKGDISSFI